MQSISLVNTLSSCLDTKYNGHAKPLDLPKEWLLCKPGLYSFHHLLVERKVTTCQTFQLEKDLMVGLEPVLVNKEVVWEIRTLNQEFLAWQPGTYLQGHCPAKTLLDNFPPLLCKTLSHRMVSIILPLSRKIIMTALGNSKKLKQELF